MEVRHTISQRELEYWQVNSYNGNCSRSLISHKEPYLEIRKKFNTRLITLREVGVPLTLVSIRGTMVAYIQHDAPHLFTQTMSDGTNFKCSEAFVRKYLRNTMNWSERRSTRAAQKLPENLMSILLNAFLREAYVIRDYAIPAALRVNTDQTQTVYQQGTKTTWNPKGAKQVGVVGEDEKRAFTLVPSISASGRLLAMQAIYLGKSEASCPRKGAPHYDEAMNLGFKIKFSNTNNYWSTLQTMKDLVNEIIEPYFEETKKVLGLPLNQCTIWKIDCWSVHKSKEFMTWMEETHPTIILIFVPGRCTGVWQPLDVGIQRVLKQSIKRSAHKDVVDETTAHLESGTLSPAVKLDTRLGTLRNRSLGWIVNAIRDIDNEDLILKVGIILILSYQCANQLPFESQQAFEMCRVGDFNCSHASLTSVEALDALRQLPKTNPSLYKQFIGECEDNGTTEDETEPEFSEDGGDMDGSDVPIDVIVSLVVKETIEQGFEVDSEGRVERTGTSEDIDAEIPKVVDVPLILGRGKRSKTASTRYDAAWEKH
jgi:DDE superfamily endonuclease